MADLQWPNYQQPQDWSGQYQNQQFQNQFAQLGQQGQGQQPPQMPQPSPMGGQIHTMPFGQGQNIDPGFNFQGNQGQGIDPGRMPGIANGVAAGLGNAIGQGFGSDHIGQLANALAPKAATKPAPQMGRRISPGVYQGANGQQIRPNYHSANPQGTQGSQLIPGTSHIQPGTFSNIGKGIAAGAVGAFTQNGGRFV